MNFDTTKYLPQKKAFKKFCSAPYRDEIRKLEVTLMGLSHSSGKRLPEITKGIAKLRKPETLTISRNDESGSHEAWWRSFLSLLERTAECERVGISKLLEFRTRADVMG
jgi:hypothetical protein